MLKFAVLASGSSGNSYVFYDGVQSIMVDMGITLKLAEERLEEAGIPAESVHSIFITHLHPDHAGSSLAAFAQKYNAKIFINKFAAKREHKSFVRLSLSPSQVCFFTLGETKVIGGFRIYSLEAFHDSVGTVSYYITSDENKICLITDTGYFSPQMVEYANMSNLLFLESNYDDDMIDDGPYPQWLKARIRSELGHLSNDQALRFLLKLDKSDTRDVYLIHISESNNKKERAQEHSSQALSLNRKIIALDRGEMFAGEI